MVTWRTGWMVGVGLVLGCSAGSDAGTTTAAAPEGFGGSDGGQGFDDREPVISDVPPPPVFGGTLLVLADGTTAVASDPDRDRVWVVDLEAHALVHEIAVGDGALPWRAVQDAHGQVHVVARGTGEVISIDPTLGELVSRRHACGNPRGVDYDLAEDRIVVACAEGSLVALPPFQGEAAVLAEIEPDLRDVLVDEDGTIHVTRFRSGEILTLEGGEVLDRFALPVFAFTGDDPTGGLGAGGNRRPSTAWRTVPAPGGGWLVTHHAATVNELPVEDDDSGGYGGGGSSCGAAVMSAVTRVDEDGTTRTTGSLRSLVLPVDSALAPDERWLAIAAAGGCGECASASLALVDLETLATEPDDCDAPIFLDIPDDPRAQIVAVAWTPDGRVLAQSREPAAIYAIDPSGSDAVAIALPGDAREDTGHELFHVDAGQGIACASCHPEGADDGYVWKFQTIGPRHTPPLDIGIEGTAPFHWSGDLPDFAALADEIRTGRMGGADQSEERIAAFEQWMYTLRSTPAGGAMTDSAIRGQALFSSRGCATCHTASVYESGESLAVGESDPMQVPPLAGVALHPPYMHDGEVETLRDAVADMLARTIPGTDPDAAEVDDLLAYLRTL